MTDLYYRDKFRNRTNLKNIRIFDTLGRLDDLSSILQKASAKFKIFPYLKNDLKESQLIKIFKDVCLPLGACRSVFSFLKKIRLNEFVLDIRLFFFNLHRLARYFCLSLYELF